MLNTAASLLTLMLAQTGALRAAESSLRTAVFELLADGELDRAAKLAGLCGGLPAEPVRVLLVAGSARGRDDLADLLERTTGPLGRPASDPGERVLYAEVGDRLAVVYPGAGRRRRRVLAGLAGITEVVAGESTEARSSELARARREAEQALDAGLRIGRRLTAFPDIGASGLLSLLAGPTAAAFAESLLRPLLEHDVSGRGDLVRSLATWLEHNGEWDAAAAALGIHRHTLRNRVRRSAALLGRDLDTAAVRAELWVALRLLGSSAPTDAGRAAGPGEPAGPAARPERRLVR